MFKIRSNVILKCIFKNLAKKPYLGIMKYNKKLQNKLGITIQDYKDYNEIIIELFPKKVDIYENIFINRKDEYKSSIHIFFNDNEESEINRNYITSSDHVWKIKVVLDWEIKSLKGLFKNCSCIKEIKFTNFSTSRIEDMSEMFYDCSNLNKIDFEKFKTDQVKFMDSIFYWCRSLKEINLNNFNTINVIDMSHMFSGCLSLL